MDRRAVLVTLLVGMVLTVTGCTIVPEPSEMPAEPLPAPPASPPTRLADLPANAPDLVKLPNGFAPEGLAIGPGPTGYLGDRENGAIYRVDLATGRGTVLSPPTGRGVQGMKLNRDRLYAAGAEAGDARVYDLGTGQLLVSLPLVKQPNKDTLVNDVLLTGDAWWLTESRSGVLYRVGLPPDGALPTQRDVRAVPLTGDFHPRPGINANGIAPTPDGKGLLVIQSNTGRLLRVDPDTGRATGVDLGGATLPDGDGLLLEGQTLYVALNDGNAVAAIQLDANAGKGRLTKRITDPRFDKPTTLAAVGDRIYLPQARFDAPTTPATAYTVIAVRPAK